MITVLQALTVHTSMIRQSGGADGVRDIPLLESALARPYMTFGGEDLYPSPIAKCAAIMESVLINHPFIDGNKRTGYALGRLILLGNKIDITASQDDKYHFVISIASGQLHFDGIVAWLKNNTSPIQ